MEEILKSYVTCDEEQMSDIVYYICKYCIDFQFSDVYRICSTSMLLMYSSQSGGA